MKPLARTGDRLLKPQTPKQQILDGQQRQKDPIAQESQTSHDSRHQGIHPVMIRRGDNSRQDHARIPDGDADVPELPESRFARLALVHAAAEDAAVVEHGAADDEGVAEVHGRHGGEGVDVVAAHPD